MFGKQFRGDPFLEDRRVQQGVAQQGQSIAAPLEQQGLGGARPRSTTIIWLRFFLDEPFKNAKAI